MDDLFSGDDPEFEGTDTPDDGRVILDGSEERMLEEIEKLEENDPNGWSNFHPDPGVTFLPVVGGRPEHHVIKHDGPDSESRADGKRLLWWGEDCIVPEHTYMLINPIRACQRKNVRTDPRTFRNILQAPRGEIFIVADSGGFQIAAGQEFELTYSESEHDFDEGVVHPKRILDWQMVNADCGTIIDIPPFDYSDDDALDGESFDDWFNGQFEDCLQTSVKNAREAYERYEEIDYDDFGLLGVVHGVPRSDGGGSTIEAHEEWFRRINEVGEYDGWTFGSGVTGTPGNMALSLAFANEYIEPEFIHALGRGSAWTRALLELYTYMTDCSMTHDCSNHTLGSQYSQFYIPGTYMQRVQITSRTIESQEDNDQDTIKPKTSSCFCPVCTALQREYDGNYFTKDESGSTFRSQAMSMHNLIHLMRIYRFISGYVSSEGPAVLEDFEIREQGVGQTPSYNKGNQFWSMIDSWMKPKETVEIYNAMCFLVEAVQDGLDQALGDYYFSNQFDQYDTSVRKDRAQDVTDWL